ncbi:TPA: hypothetical protein ACPSKE_002739 [Legionella feeleii]|uniref:Secreted protein n=1 Tax=Legionella feeleii TaxID=453 RepID=A0A378IXD6_9GAMM|nr:hypothetical protein [Legionella feeleii]STX39570.1 Uncharacterised protein [Legionella feeleii]
MKVKQAITCTLGIIVPSLFYNANAAQCSYELPPNEQLTLNGNENTSRQLSCKVEHSGQESDYLIDFVSETNTSFVNNLMMPEGTIMSLSFASMNNNELRFELKPKARLGITNDSADFIRLKCINS